MAQLFQQTRQKAQYHFARGEGKGRLRKGHQKGGSKGMTRGFSLHGPRRYAYISQGQKKKPQGRHVWLRRWAKSYPKDPQGTPRNYASAKALSRIPIIFGGQAGTARSAEGAEMISLTSATIQPRATSGPAPPTIPNLLFGGAPGPAAGIAAILEPGTVFTGPQPMQVTEPVLRLSSLT